MKGSIDADLTEGSLPLVGGPYEKRFHFDNNFSYEAVIANYAALARLVERNLAKTERDPWEFGKILHAIEDFYSHSNYIVLYRDYVAQNGNELVGSISPFEEVLVNPRTYKTFIAMLKRDLRTGRYPLPKWWVIPTDTDHGYPIGPGMHRDGVNRPLFADARQTATLAATWYLQLYAKDRDARKKWKSLVQSHFRSAAR